MTPDNTGKSFGTHEQSKPIRPVIRYVGDLSSRCACCRFLLDAPESYRPGLWAGKFVMVTSPKRERYKVRH